MELSHQSLSELPKGPFTATKLWNEMVSQMKAHLQVKRRRWRMKQYDDVFVASEALDWLHEYLKTNPNFGPTVNRQQAVQLCKKFLSHNIIEDARGKQYNSVFEDNSHLYRFVNLRQSPYKREHSPRKNSIREKPPVAKHQSCDSASSLSHTPPKLLRRSTRFSLNYRTSYSNAPTRTPLGSLSNQVNVMGSIKSDSRGLKSGGMKKKLNRRESDVIMNPAALGFQANRRSLTEKEITELWWNVAVTRLSGLLEVECPSHQYKYNDYDIECVRENMEERGICKASDIVPPWLLSAMKCLVNWPLDKGDVSNSFPKYPGFERDVFRAVTEYFDGFSESLVGANILPLFKMTAGVIVKCKATAMRAVQYCCMLLQPHKRKNLQIAIKLMIRLTQNKDLVLSDTLPTKELLIKTFSRCTFGKNGDMDVIRLLFFMMDSFPVCFMKPDGLQFQVEQRILFLQNCRGKVPTKPMTKSTTFCERVTTKEFEEEGMRSSQTALRDLLNQIITDESISEKERKKKFKQFEKSYPDIYYSKFPSDAISTSSTLSRKSERLRKNFTRPLNALKNLR